MARKLHNAANKEKYIKGERDSQERYLGRSMTLRGGTEVSLTLTVHEKQMAMRGIGSRGSDEGYASCSPVSAKSTMVPMTIPEERRKSPSTPGEGWLSRLRWGQVDVEDEKRREKEQQAEKYLTSFSGRSLTIQKEMLQRTLNKEKRRIKFGLVSGKLMELAMRRYSYK